MSIKGMKRILAQAACSVVAIAAVSGTALAGPMYTFDVSVGTQPSNVGVITLVQNGTDSVDVVVDLLDGYGFINTGGPHTPFAFNLMGTGVLDITFTLPSNGVYASGVFSLNTSGGGNTPYGTYDVAIDSTAGNGSGNGYFGDLVFTLSRSTGLDTMDFVANTDGYYFSADLTDGSNTGAQAWATREEVCTVNCGGGGLNIPEPASLGLFGLGLIGLGYATRRRRSS